jgi:cell division septum initiation protein DivIVA
LEENMDFMALLDKLDDLIGQSRSIPLTQITLVNRKRLFSLMDQIRTTLPEEVKQARWIVKERSEMLDEAEKESSRIIEDARIGAENMAAETEIVRLAEHQAKEVIEAAKVREREIRLGAEDYADEMLAKLEVDLGKLLNAVQRGRDRLQGRIEQRV